MSIKAKSVSKGFGVAAGGKASAARSSQVKPDIKTKGELNYRQKQRTTPNLVLEPKSVTQRLSTLRQQSNRQNEDRITVLNNSLDEAGSNLRQQYRLSILRGETKAPARSRDTKERTK